MRARAMLPAPVLIGAALAVSAQALGRPSIQQLNAYFESLTDPGAKLNMATSAGPHAAADECRGSSAQPAVGTSAAAKLWREEPQLRAQ